MFGVAYLLYFVTNHHPYFTPKELPMSWIDEAVPFVPWTVLIYVSEYFYFTFVYMLCRNHRVLNQYLYAFFCTQLFSCAIFFFFPTTYPRDLFPIPEGTNGFIESVWIWLRNQDAATNCFPSLHVSTVYLSAFIFWKVDTKLFRFFLIWGTLIALSTLPTKQHYFVDILAGVSLGLSSYWYFFVKMKYFNYRGFVLEA